MLRIFLSSTYRDLKDPRSEIFEKLNSVCEGVGMEKFIPDGETSHKICIDDLRKSDIIIFLISPYYGSLIDVCELKDNCKADCSMKTGKGRISYTHCEYKTAIAEKKLHQTYKVLEGWNIQDKKELLQFEEEIGKELWVGVQDIEDPNLVQLICNNLATKIVEWHSKNELNFSDFCDRSSELTDILENFDKKLEVYGVGGIGKTALIQIALLIQKLKGKEIITIGVEQSYGSGSGYSDFRDKCKKYQYEITSKIITIYDILDALSKIKPDLSEVKDKQKNEIIKILQEFVRSEENLILFIDDFHYADADVLQFVKGINKIVFSSRKTTGLARKELCLVGIKEEDREDFIQLLCGRHKKNLTYEAKKTILKITDGHPVSTELIVRNAEYINFNELKEFDLKNDLKNVNSVQVEKFLNRVVEEILSEKAFTLIKNISMLNVNLDNNIERESVEESFEINNINEFFNELITTGMLKKIEGKEGIYKFSYKHVQDALEDIKDKERHENAIKYYEKKKEIIGENVDDTVEVLYHKVKSNSSDQLLNEFLEIKKKIQPIHYGFKRLIDVGEELKKKIKQLADKNPKKYLPKVADAQNNLGQLYDDLHRFEEAETAYIEALRIRQELADRNPKKFLPRVADTLNNLGFLYKTLKRYGDAEKSILTALGISKELTSKDYDAYLPNLALTQNSLGILYAELGRFEEAESILNKTLEIRKELAEKDPNMYLPKVAIMQHNLGNLYWNLRRFEEAESLLNKSLEIRKELADKNPEAYLPDIGSTQNNIGALYYSLRRFEEAEHAYIEALDIYKELADKNPEAYLYFFAFIQNNIGEVYKDLKRYDKAEKSLLAALRIGKELADKNPEAYMWFVAETKNNLGLLYKDLKRYEDAKKFYLAALRIRKELADKNPEAYLSCIAETQNNLGLLYKDLKRYGDAEKVLLAALRIRKELAKKTPEAYVKYVAETQNNLGLLYTHLKRFGEAEKFLSEVLKLDSNFGDAWYNKACLESLRNNQGKSLECLKKAIEIDKAYIDTAKTDESFDNILNLKEFKKQIWE